MPRYRFERAKGLCRSCVAVVPLLLLTASSLVAQSVGASVPRATTVERLRETSAPLTAQQRRAALDSASVLVAARYPDLPRAAELADSLRAWSRRDAFSRLNDAQQLADTLGPALRRIVNDRHLYVRYQPDVEFGETQGPSAQASTAGRSNQPVIRRSARVDPRDSATVAATNNGFDRVERLDGNIGMLKISRFVPLDWARPTADAALAFLRNTDAVIVDVRDVPGGAPPMVQYLLSHFLQGPATLMHVSQGRLAPTHDSLFTLPEVANRGLAGKPLVILTNRRTASAAEMLAYYGQRLELATVVGDTTSGAGNGGRLHTIGSGLQLFVPERQVLTGPGWEQTGVAPDVVTTADDALTRAHVIARERAATRRSDRNGSTSQN